MRANDAERGRFKSIFTHAVYVPHDSRLGRINKEDGDETLYFLDSLYAHQGFEDWASNEWRFFPFSANELADALAQGTSLYVHLWKLRGELE